MTYEESILNLTENETQLEKRYDALLPQQMDLYHWLVEKLEMDPANAIICAEESSPKPRKIEPRLADIFDKSTADEWYSSLINMKNDIKEYRDLNDWYQTIVWYRVTKWDESLFIALKSANGNGNPNPGYVELVGRFKTDEEFGRYLVFERDYLWNWEYEEILKWFGNNAELTQSYQPYKSFNDLIDFEKVAEHALYGSHGGAGISHYDKVIDPEHPREYSYFYTE